MKIKKTSDFVEGAGIYEISFEKDKEIIAFMNEKKSNEDDYYGPSFGMDASFFCEVYRRIYNRITGGAYMNGPRLLVYTNKDIFDEKEIYNDKIGSTVFYETVKQFHEIGWYKPIIDLIVCMVAVFEHVNLRAVKSILEVFEITENYSLDQLCQDAYEMFINEYENESTYYCRLLDDSDALDLSENTNENVVIPNGFDVFHCTEEDRKQGLILDNIMVLVEKPSSEKEFFTAWMKPFAKLMGNNQITSSNDIDQLIKWCTSLSYEDDFRANIREEHLVFLAGRESEAIDVARKTVGRSLGDKDVFRYRRKGLGFLRELDHVDKDVRIEKSLEILADMSDDMFTEALDLLLGYVEGHITSLIASNYREFYEKKDDSYNTDYLFTEMGGNDAFLETSKKVFEKWNFRGKTITEFVSAITPIRESMNPEEGITLEIGSIIVSGLIYLYVSNHYDQAIDYIISYNKYIEKYDRADNIYAHWVIYHVWQTLVARCFYHVENLDKANIVLGIINEYTSECERSKEKLNYEVDRALEQIENEKVYLRNISPILEYYGHADSIETDMYSDGAIDGTANEIKRAIMINKRISPNSFMDLFRYATLLDIDRNNEEYSIVKWRMNQNHLFVRRYEAIEYRIILSDVFFTDTTTFIDFCEMYDQQKGFDDCAEDRQLLVSGDLLTGIKNAKLLSTKRINMLQDQSLEQTITRISELKQSLSGKGATDEEILKVLEDIVQDLSERSVIKDSKWEMIREELYLMELSFYESYGMEPEDLVDEKLNSDAYTFWNYLITSERVFRYLSKSGDSEKADYSAALISLTKAIELVLNNIYRKAISQEYAAEKIKNSLPGHFAKHYFNDNKHTELMESLALGPLIKIWIYGSLISKSGEIELDSKDKKYDGIFKGLSFNEYIDIKKLDVFKGHSVKVTKDSKRKDKEKIEAKELIFDSDEDYNRRLLGWGLDYIREKYRNKTAHNDVIMKNDVEECRKLLVQGESLLWVLLYIMK